MQGLLNPSIERDPAYRGLFSDREYASVARFYADHPELAPTPLRTLPALARRLGLAEILVKDESSRWGVEAFKIAGVRYSVEKLDPHSLKNGLVCATAGNHGRAVARVARDLGLACSVFLPAARSSAHPSERITRAARVAAMRADGAAVVETDGSYEEAVALAAAHGTSTGATIVSDTAWPGYDEIPRTIMTGYTRLFDEAAASWSSRPDVVLVQGGVGGLVCAAANWFAFRYGPDRPFLVACEPDDAACLLQSARARRMIDLNDDVPSGSARGKPALNTIMAGLRCAQPSPAAWPSIQSGIDAFVSVPDQLALDAIEVLRTPDGNDPSIQAGPSGACGLAALIALAQAPALEPVRQAGRVGRSTRVMAIVTEGP
jgi:diaminopropionate ammonia-lyase